MAGSRLRLEVIIGSVRGGRLAPTVGKWIAEEIRQFDQFAFGVLDLADIDLPLATPAFGDDPEPAVAARLGPFSRRLAEADAFVVVTPEYNHSFPAVLKNAIDWHSKEWYAKPVGIVSYGGISGGLRATEQLRGVFAELHAVTIRDTVSFHNAGSHWDAEGHWPKEPESVNAATKTLLGQLAWWARALADAKAKSPYPA